MNEQHFGNSIRQILNQGLGRDRVVAEKLRTARERALARQRREPAPALVWADNVFGRFEGWGDLSLRLVLPLALLVAALAGVYQWEQNQRLAELEEIDVQLLTGELPIDAYLDHGFQDWLTQDDAEE